MASSRVAVGIVYSLGGRSQDMYNTRYGAGPGAGPCGGKAAGRAAPDVAALRSRLGEVKTTKHSIAHRVESR